MPNADERGSGWQAAETEALSREGEEGEGEEEVHARIN